MMSAAPFLAALAVRDWPGLVRQFGMRRALSAGALLMPEPLRRQMLVFRGHLSAATARPWRDHHPVRPAFADAQELDAEGAVWFSTYMPPADERHALLHLHQRRDPGLVGHAFRHLTGAVQEGALGHCPIEGHHLALMPRTSSDAAVSMPQRACAPVVKSNK